MLEFNEIDYPTIEDYKAKLMVENTVESMNYINDNNLTLNG